MVVSFLPLALMASASALPSGSVKPPSIRTASRAPEINTGARKNACSPVGKCFQVRLVFAAIAFFTPRMAVATLAAATVLITSLRVVMGLRLLKAPATARGITLHGVAGGAAQPPGRHCHPTLHRQHRLA